MNLKDKMIMEEFRREKKNFLELEKVVSELLSEAVKGAEILVAGIEHRVKKEESLEGKLHKHGDAYTSLSDITDLLGARIICYFTDDVDKIGKIVEDKFEIDWKNYSDKRALMKADAFGYISLHYICSLRSDSGYPEALVGKKFEIQIRTMLQHAWAAINHDLGYKTDFGVPNEVVREFARLAGLLEIADNEFTRVRDHIKEYTEQVRLKIINNEADDVDIDIISLREYMIRNKKMRAFVLELAQIEGSEIVESNPDNYIKQLEWMKIDTIGKLSALLDKNRATALGIARKALKGTEIDILASNVALLFLCRAELVAGEYTEEQITEFESISNGNQARAARQAKRIMKLKEEFCAL